MLRFFSVGCIAVAGVLACSPQPAAGQIPPETSLYELIDIVPAPAPVSCGCIPSAFALPTFRPGPGWGSGPATPAEQAPLPESVRALYAARLEEARARLPRNAEDGLDGNSHASIGVAMHLRDESLAAGVDKKLEEEAARWMHLAAAQEHPDAFMFLAYRYQRGRGVPQSDEGAAYWFYQGAVRGNNPSMLALGLRYATGRGVQQDYAAAVYWWRRASGTPLASRFLGDAYACGLGVDRNPDRAVREYKKAFDDGETSTNMQLGRLYMSGCVAPNNDAAIKAFRRAADEGNPEAQIVLSELFLQGRGVETDASEAYYWARMAERRLPEGEQRALARVRVKAAARGLSADAIAAADALVEAMIAATVKPK